MKIELEKKNIFQQNYKITKEKRNFQNKYKSLLILFTGLSGSGKSTLANLVENELFKSNISTYTLDGDNLRHGLNSDLEFSIKDREENIRRVAEVSKLIVEAGVVTLAAFVSPYSKDRKMMKDIVGNDNFIEIYVSTSLEECEKRDVKGLYKKARLGEISNFTGISSSYEKPINPHMEISTENETIEDSVARITNFIKNKIVL